MTQVWQFGDVKFSDYGVYVQSHSGVLDFPALTDEGHDWLDQNGKSYWLGANELKKSDRDLVLNCWIAARSYGDFKTNAEAFLTAIAAEGLEIMTTPWTTLTNVALHDSVPVVRRSAYVMSRQLGVFTLRMKVVGDSLYATTMYVYRDHTPFAVPIGAIMAGSDLKVVKRMHGEAYVTCQVERNDNTTFKRDDYIKVYSGASMEKYYLDKDPEVRKHSSNKFVISYRFEQEPYRLRNIVFLSESGESDFYWFANLEEVLDRLMINADRYQSGLFVREATIPATVRKTHKFSGQSCWDVLVSLCQDYELEFQWLYDGSSVWTLDVEERIERAWPYTMEYGKGEGFWEITREALDREELCTVLYAYGANKNLKYDYGYERLVCPGNPLTSNTGLYGRIEQVKFFDDVFPAFNGTVAAYEQILPVTGDAAYEAIKEVWPTGRYRVTATLGFNLAETDAQGYSTYLLGIPPKIAMRTGDLAGMEFEIGKYDPVDPDVPDGAGYIYLDPIVDEHAGTFPNEDFYPAAGDGFTLLDIKQPETYVASAEQDLMIAASGWLADHSVPKITYRAVLDPAIVREIESAGQGVNIGDAIEVIDADLNMDGTYRISELTMDYETRRCDITLSEKRPLTPREVLVQSVRNLQKTVESTKANTEVGTQKSDETTAEVINRVFDRRDGRFKPDNIRTESIDPRQLAYDSGVPQFQVKGLLVTTPYKGDQNKVLVEAGSIEVLNWVPNARTRYEIARQEEEGDLYDPRRTWTFESDVITLPDDDLYYLIAMLPRDTALTVGTVIASDTWRRVKYDTEYLYYTLGMINEPGSPRVASMLWGNVRTSPETITNAIDPRLLGGGRVLYLHGNEGDLTGYGVAQFTEPDDPYYWYSASGADTRLLLAQFASPTGMGTIPAGAWVFTTYGAVTTDDQIDLGVEVYRVDATGGESELVTFSQDMDGVVVAPLYHAEPMDQLVLDDSERLVFRYYADFDSVTPHTAYMDVEGDEAGYYWWSNVRIPGDGNTAATGGGLSTVYTRYSVTGDGSSGTPVELVGDELSPAPLYYYGTDASGVRGYHALTEQVNADWNATEGVAEILNKPVIPDAQIQSDWNQSATGALDYIKNKPVIPEDNYVDGMSFDNGTRVLTLTRTGSLPDLTATIPDASGGGGLVIGDWTEDISFDFNDVEAGVAQTWILDIKASFAYKILSVVLQSDSTMDDVTVEIAGSPITWDLPGDPVSIDVTSSVVETTAKTDVDNDVAVGEQVTLVKSATDGDPTVIRGKLKIQRVAV